MIAADKIRLRRLELRLSQEALGKAVGQDQAYISRLETGRITDFTAVTLARLARTLKVQMEDLMLPESAEGDT